MDLLGHVLPSLLIGFIALWIGMLILVLLLKFGSAMFLGIEEAEPRQAVS